LASVRGRSLGCILRLCADDFCEALPAGAAALSFRLLSDLLLPPLSERHVSVLVRKLPPPEDDVVLLAGGVDDVGLLPGAAGGWTTEAPEMGSGVDAPDRLPLPAHDEDEDDEDEKDLRTRRFQRSLIDIVAAAVGDVDGAVCPGTTCRRWER